MDVTGSIDNSEVRNSCGEILQNLQARERALKAILENLDLSLSCFSAAARRKIEETAETLKNQEICQVNKENIMLSHMKKTLENDEDLMIHSKLVLQKAEIENAHIVASEDNSIFNKAINTYESGIKKVSEELNENLGPTMLSPESKASSTSDSRKRDLQRKVSALCKKLYEKKMRANQLTEKLSAFQGLPDDVESAKHQIYLKQTELEEINERLEELHNSSI